MQRARLLRTATTVDSIAGQAPRPERAAMDVELTHERPMAHWVLNAIGVNYQRRWPLKIHRSIRTIVGLNAAKPVNALQHKSRLIGCRPWLALHSRQAATQQVQHNEGFLPG
jgi:hypothetical protein